MTLIHIFMTICLCEATLADVYVHSDVFLETQTKIQKDFLITTLPTIEKTFNISFWFLPKNGDRWSHVIQFMVGKNVPQVMGDRIPDIYYHGGSMAKLRIYFDYYNHVKSHVDINNVKPDMWHQVTITRTKNGSGPYSIQFKVDKQSSTPITEVTPQIFRNVQVYATESKLNLKEWGTEYPPLNAFIKDLRIVNECPQVDTDYVWSSQNVNKKKKVATWKDCSMECSKDTGCNYWTYYTNGYLRDMCFMLVITTLSTKKQTGVISGPRGCGIKASPVKTICPMEKGYCVQPNGWDQNSGVRRLNSLDGNTEERRAACLKQCRVYRGATGCEVIWKISNRGCWVHTKKVSRGNGANYHACWVFSKCYGEKLKNCTEEYYGNVDYKGRYHFKSSHSMTYVDADEKKCKYGYNVGNSTVARYCSSNGTWNDPDLSFCKSKEDTETLLTLAKKNVTQIAVEGVAKKASQLVTKMSITKPSTIDAIADVLTVVTEVNVSKIEVAVDVLKCVGAIIDADENVVKAAKPKSLEKVVKSLEKIALAQSPKNRGEERVISLQQLATITSFDEQSHYNISFNQHVNYTVPSVSTSFIHLPQDVIEEAGDNVVYSYVFRSANLFQVRDNSPKYNGSRMSMVGSSVFSVTINGTEINGRENAIEMEFDLNKGIKNYKYNEAKCKFWDESVYNNETGTYGEWSSRGCNTSTGTINTVRCTCDHLTNFAIILDISQMSDTSVVLDVLSSVGCGVSICCLVLTIIISLWFKAIREKPSSKILINLSLSLLLTYTTFISGVEQSKHVIGCRVVALLLQYFALATFTWMAIEGYNLYRSIIVVDLVRSNERFIPKCLLVGWGGPLIITGVTAAVQWKSIGRYKFCVLRSNTFYIAQAFPILLILIANFFVLILVIRKIMKRKNINEHEQQDKSLRDQIRIAFTLTCILGSTWLFGFLAVGDATFVFKLLFCIFNSLQGVFIFGFHTLREEALRAVVRRMFPSLRRKKESTTLTVTFSSLKYASMKK